MAPDSSSRSEKAITNPIFTPFLETQLTCSPTQETWDFPLPPAAPPGTFGLISDNSGEAFSRVSCLGSQLEN